MSFHFLPLRVGSRVHGLDGTACPWEMWVCISATAVCAQHSPGRMLAEPQSSCLPAHIWAASFHLCQLPVQDSLQPSTSLLCFPILSAFQEIHADTDCSGPHFWHPVSKFCLDGIAADNQEWVQKKYYLIVKKCILPILQLFLSFWNPFEPPKMPTIPRHRELWSSRIQSALFLFLVFHPEICFSPYDPWSMQSRKGLSIYISFHSLVGDSVACTCFEIPALDTEKWEGNYLIKLFSLPLVNSIWQLWEIVFKRAHYCAVWISEIKVKLSYFLTAYFPSGCPIITSASVTGSGSSDVISTLWKSLMPFWFIYFLIYSFSCSTVLGGGLAVLNQGMAECFAAWTVLLCIQHGEFFEQGHRGCCCCDYWNYLTSFVLFFMSTNSLVMGKPWKLVILS